MIPAILFHGLITGAIYALLAVGFSLIFGVARIANLAHTAFYMAAAYIIYACTSLMGMNLYLAVIISIIVTTALGASVYRLNIRPVKESEPTLLVMTIAVAIIFQETIDLTVGTDYVSVAPFIPGYIALFGVRLLRQELLTLGISVAVLLAVWMSLTRAKFGKAILATAQDAEAASYLGVDTERVNLIVMIISVLLAAVAGAIVAPLLILNNLMWNPVLLTLLAICIIGGLGSIKGSIAASFILAYTETFVIFFLPMGGFLKGAVAMAMMLAIIVIRPGGLFGVRLE